MQTMYCILLHTANAPKAPNGSLSHPQIHIPLAAPSVISSVTAVHRARPPGVRSRVCCPWRLGWLCCVLRLLVLFMRGNVPGVRASICFTHENKVRRFEHRDTAQTYTHTYFVSVSLFDRDPTQQYSIVWECHYLYLCCSAACEAKLRGCRVHEVNQCAARRLTKWFAAVSGFFVVVVKREFGTRRSLCSGTFRASGTTGGQCTQFHGKPLGFAVVIRYLPFCLHSDDRV